MLCVFAEVEGPRMQAAFYGEQQCMLRGEGIFCPKSDSSAQ